MADDLRLQVVIEALLDAKGFEEAQAAIKQAANNASSAAPAVKKMSESFGGTRGPVADLTRVLLLNSGVTGAAGEAAKAAGISMYYMEGAATAANVAIAGSVAAVALLLPMLVRWVSGTKEQNKEQKELKDKMDAIIPVLEKYRSVIGALGDPAAIQLMAEHGKLLKAEAQELKEQTAAYEALRHQIEETNKASALRVKGAGGTEQMLVEATKMKARIDDLTAAQARNITTEEMLSERGDKAIEVLKKKEQATKKQTDAEKELTFAEKMAARQEIDAAVDIILETQKVDKARAKAVADEIAQGLALAEVDRRQINLDQQVIDDKKLQHRTIQELYTQTITTAVTAFTKNKAINIAAAIADTWAAVAKTLAAYPYPVNVAFAALTAAQGLAAVQHIRETAVGFDDPFADLTARRLGRKSAVDFVANFGAGFHSGMGQAMVGGGNSYHTTINRGTNIGSLTLPGFMGAGKTEMMKALNRELIKVQRLEGRTTVGR